MLTVSALLPAGLSLAHAQHKIENPHIPRTISPYFRHPDLRPSPHILRELFRQAGLTVRSMG